MVCPSLETARQTTTQVPSEQTTRDNSAVKRCTPLMRASEDGNLEAVRALLKERVDLNVKLFYRHRHTALMLAAKKGHLEIVRALLSAGADVNVNAPGLDTALRFAARGGHLEVVKALLNAGAEANLRDFDFHSGEYWGLMAAMDRCNKDWLKIVDAMIAAGAELSPKAGFSRSPFTYAVRKRDVVMTKALLDRGADVNSKNWDGDTPLMSAVTVLVGDPRMVRFLLAAGADVNARNLKGETALDIVRQLKRDFPNSEQDEIIRLLKNAARSSTKRNAKHH